MPNDDTLEQDLERELEQELLKVSRLCMRWGSHVQSRVLNCTCVHVCCTQDPSNPENKYALRVLAAGKESALCAMVLDAWPRAFINGGSEC